MRDIEILLRLTFIQYLVVYVYTEAFQAGYIMGLDDMSDISQKPAFTKTKSTIKSTKATIV